MPNPTDDDRPIDALIRLGFRPQAGEDRERRDRIALAVEEITAASRVPPAAPRTPRPALRTGGDAFARYEMSDSVGRGGVGEVFRGRDRELGRDVAIKVLAEEHRDNEALVARFVEEARIGGRLQHPGVVPVHEVGYRDDGCPYFTMKLVEGATFGELLQSRPTPADDRLRMLGVFERVCETMAYAHARGVVHRDLKPLNVMVGAFGEVQVMDWGLAKVVASAGTEAELAGAPTVFMPVDGSRSQAGMVMGTPAYMAPEQARGEVDRIDARTDVFALGAMLCEILTGEPPYAGKGGEVWLQARDGALGPAQARLAASGADRELVALAIEALASARDDRPRDAGVLADRLQRHRAEREERLRRAEIDAARARGRLAMALAAVVVLLVIAAAVYWQEMERDARVSELAARLVTAVGETEQAHAAARAQEDPLRWEAARAAAKRARDLAASADADPSTRARIDSLAARVEADASRAEAVDARRRRDEAMSVRLERIRLLPTSRDPAQPARAYTRALRDHGVDLDTLTPDAAAAKITASAIARDLIAALDGLAFLLVGWNPAAAARVVAVAQRADADPHRRAAREALLAQDVERLKTMARALESAPEPPETVALVAAHLGRLGESAAAIALLRRAVEVHPGDFWMHDQLGRWLMLRVPPDTTGALRHRAVVRALRPESPAAWISTSDTRKVAGDLPGAERAVRRALVLDPEWAPAHFELAEVLLARGSVEASITAMREAIRRDDQSPFWHYSLARQLLRRGERTEAEAALARTVERMPGHLEARELIGMLKLRRGDRAGAEAAFRAVLVHADAGGSSQGASVRDVHQSLGYEPDRAVGSAAFQLAEIAATRGHIGEAIRLYGKAARRDPSRYLAGGKAAMLELESGRLAAAETTAREVLRHHPDFPLACAVLGQSLEFRGRYDEALDAYARGERGAKKMGVRFPGSLAAACRGKQATMPEVEALAAGKAPPVEPRQLVVLAGVCLDRGEAVLAATLWTKALEHEWPVREVELHRERAAVAAALAAAAMAPRAAGVALGAGGVVPGAGGGDGAEASDLDAAAHSAWRRRAIGWLRANLEAWKARAEEHPDQIAVLRKQLGTWRHHTALAGLRDEPHLAAVPEADRKACLAFWREVDAVLASE